jgi:zinc protease
MFRPLRATIAALLLLSAGCATGLGAGLPDEPKLGDYEPKRWVGTPKSGLRIIVQEDHSSPLVNVVTSFGVGATADPKGKEGLAHFVEHLVFRSKAFGGDQPVWDILKRTGGSFNASTSWDFTNYTTMAHKDHLKLLLQLEAWRLLNTVGGVTADEFKTEREVVRNELRQRWETTAGNKLFDLLFESLYPVGHPLRRPVGGTHESLTASQLEDAQAFVKQHYRPDNAVITIIGDVSTEEVKSMIGTWPKELLFGPGGESGPAVEPRKRVGERAAPPVPKPVSTSLARHKGPIASPVLMLAWSLPPGWRGKDAMAEFAADRLSAALGGLDMKDEDDIMGAGAFSMPLADSSIVVLQASLRPWADPEKARKRLMDVLVYAAWGSSQQETTGNRWGAAASLLRQAAEPLFTAEELAQYMAATGRHNYFKEHFDELLALKSGDVGDFAGEWLTRDRAVAVYFEPESDRMPAALGGGGGGGGGGGAENASHDIARGIAPNWSQLTSERLLQVMKSPNLAAVPKFTIQNGLDVYVVERTDSPMAYIRLGLRGGQTAMRPVGAAQIADALASPKCREYPRLGAVAGSAGSGVGLDNSTASASVFRGNLANGMAALRDTVSCVEVNPEGFIDLARQLEQQAKVFDKTAVYPDFIAGKWFRNHLYPGHAYGEVGTVSPAAYKDLRQEDAQAFVSSLYRPGNAVAVVYGGVKVDQVKAEAEKYLTTWRGGSSGASLAAPPAPQGPTSRMINVVNRDKATQAVVSIGCRLTPVEPDTYPAYDVLEAMAGESAWTLREQYGATYGIQASVTTNGDRSAHLVLGGAIVNAQAGTSVQRLLQIVAAMANATIAEPLFNTKRWDTGREFTFRMSLAATQASSIIAAKHLGWSLDVWDKYPDNLAKTTRETIKTIMAPCVGKEVIAIVGDAAVLKPQLEAAGLKVSN